MAIVLALLAGGIPLCAAYVFYEHLATEAQKSHLLNLSADMLGRAEMHFTAASAMLGAANRLSLDACTDAHIAAMRQLTMNTRSVDEIQYFRDGELACSSWGRGSGSMSFDPPLFHIDTKTCGI